MIITFLARRIPNQTAQSYLNDSFTLTVQSKNYRDAENKAKEFVKNYDKWTCGTSGGWTTELSTRKVEI